MLRARPPSLSLFINLFMDLREFRLFWHSSSLRSILSISKLLKKFADVLKTQYGFRTAFENQNSEVQTLISALVVGT